MVVKLVICLCRLIAEARKEMRSFVVVFVGLQFFLVKLFLNSCHISVHSLPLFDSHLLIKLFLVDLSFLKLSLL